MQYPDDFVNKVILGDNIVVMKDIPDEVIDLIYLDPPYGDNKVDKIFELEWRDLEHYLSWIKERLYECHRVLKSTGSIYLHCDHRTTHHLRFLLDEIFGVENFKNTIAWCYTNTTNAKRWYPHRHQDIHFYTKTEKHTFNRDKIKFVKGYYSKLDRSDFKYAEDYWIDINSANQGFMTKKDDILKKPFSTQKSVGLLDRIIKVSSNEKDIILDPFCGSGTTFKSAWKLNRFFIGIDKSKDAVELSTDRIKEDLGQKRFDSF